MTDPNLYKDSDARFNTVIGDNAYFTLLRGIRTEFDNTTPYDSYSYEFDQGDFMRFIEERYGIQPQFDSTYQAITEEFKIVDEQKYLLAKIKFT